jgi:hypothetical protein
MLKPDDEQSFFDRERDRLTGEIATVRSVPCLALPSRPRVSVSRFKRILIAMLFFLFLRDSKNYYRAATS